MRKITAQNFIKIANFDLKFCEMILETIIDQVSKEKKNVKNVNVKSGFKMIHNKLCPDCLPIFKLQNFKTFAKRSKC